MWYQGHIPLLGKSRSLNSCVSGSGSSLKLICSMWVNLPSSLTRTRLAPCALQGGSDPVGHILSWSRLRPVQVYLFIRYSWWLRHEKLLLRESFLLRLKFTPSTISNFVVETKIWAHYIGTNLFVSCAHQCRYRKLAKEFLSAQLKAQVHGGYTP